MNTIHLISSDTFYKDVLEYIYHVEKDKINDFVYLEEQMYKQYRYNSCSIEVPCMGNIRYT